MRLSRFYSLLLNNLGCHKTHPTTHRLKHVIIEFEACFQKGAGVFAPWI
jgi:hypothetical protein